MTEPNRIITVDMNKLRVSDSGDMTSDQPFGTENAETDIMRSLDKSVFMDPKTSLYEVIEKSEYLKHYPSWLDFCDPEHKKRFAPTFVARNNLIWELVLNERGYMEFLMMVRDLYVLPFPDFEPTERGAHSTIQLSGDKLREALFPALGKLIEAHERLLRPLLALHEQSENHIVRSLGSCLVQVLDSKTQQTLSQLYGGFTFAQKRSRDLLQDCQRIPVVAQFIEKCSQDPRLARRLPQDCHLVIVHRWTKVVTLLDAIIKNTLNQPIEVENLETVRITVHNLLKGSEAVLSKLENADKLQEFSSRFVVSSDDPSEQYVQSMMQRSSTTLVNYGPLRVRVGQALVDAIGVALNDCFFVLQNVPEGGNYQLLKDVKMPPVVRWGHTYGYFRRQVRKGAYGFFILFQAETVLAQFQCNTVDEVNRWEQTFNEGFAKWDASSCTIESLNSQLQQLRLSTAQSWRNAEAVIGLLHELDADVERAWAARAMVSLVLIEERLKAVQLSGDTTNIDSAVLTATPNSATHPPCAIDGDNSGSGVSGSVTLQSQAYNTPSVTSEWIEQNFVSSRNTDDRLGRMLTLFREIFVRLQFALACPSAGLSRSASDVDERKPRSKPLKKTETFSVRDKNKDIHDTKGPNGLPVKSLSKKRDSHGISATMVNIFRGSGRDKPSACSIQPIPIEWTNPLISPSPGQSKGSQSRPPLATTSNASTTTMARVNSAANAAHPSSQSSRLSLCVASSGEPSPLIGSDRCSTTHSAAGSSSSLTSPQLVEGLDLLKDLTELADEFFPVIHRLRTQNHELLSRNRVLEMENTKLSEIYELAKQHGLQKSLVANTGGTPNGVDPVTSDATASTFSLHQQTEKLRRDVEQFRMRSDEWEKEYKRQRDALERDHAKLAKEWTRYEEAKAEFDEQLKRYNEMRKTLQQQLDLYASQGVKFTGMNVPNLSIPGLTIPSGEDLRRGSCNSLADLTSLSQPFDRSKSVHKHSTSDDLTGRWAQPTGMFKDTRSREFVAGVASPDVSYDSTPRPSLVPTHPTRSDDLPMHLRGSLVNQPPLNPVSSSHPAGFDPLTQLAADSSSASSPALLKLGDPAKPSASKHRKSNIFRRT